MVPVYANETVQSPIDSNIATGGSGYLTFSESVLELSGDSLEVTHTASAGGSPSLSLLAPLV